jgi:pentatricopeptide repeat protein
MGVGSLSGNLPLICSQVTFNSMLGGLMGRREISEAEALLEKMKNQGLKPTVVTFNIMIDHYAKAGFQVKGWSGCLHCAGLRRGISDLTT